MAKIRTPKPAQTDNAIVDRLLRQLPFANARDDEGGPKRTPSGSWARGPIVGVSRRDRDLGPVTPRERAGVWARAVLGLFLLLGVTQWPYAHACGIPLGVYLAAVAATLGAGGWASVAAWRRRLATPHVVGLIVIVAALAMAAHEVVSRTGYVRVAGSWSCG